MQKKEKSDWACFDCAEVHKNAIFRDWLFITIKIFI